MTKPQEHKQRFYLWDYIWWQGEKFQQARRKGKVSGDLMLSLYIFSLILCSVMIVFTRLLPTASSPLILAVFLPLSLAVITLVGRIYRRRGKAVMHHYVRLSFYEVIAVFLFFLPIAIIYFLMWLLRQVEM